MTTIANLRSGLNTRLATIADVQTSAYMLSVPAPPCVEVSTLDEVLYDRTMQRGFDEYRFIIRAYSGLTSDIGAQKTLDLFLASSGSGSVKAAVEGDRTLGGVCSDLQVESCSGYRVYAADGRGPFLGAEWTVRVLATGT